MSGFFQKALALFIFTLLEQFKVYVISASLLFLS